MTPRTVESHSCSDACYWSTSHCTLAVATMPLLLCLSHEPLHSRRYKARDFLSQLKLQCPTNYGVACATTLLLVQEQSEKMVKLERPKLLRYLRHLPLIMPTNGMSADSTNGALTVGNSKLHNWIPSAETCVHITCKYSKYISIYISKKFCADLHGTSMAC